MNAEQESLVQQKPEQQKPPEHEKGPVSIVSFPCKQIDLPVLSASADIDLNMDSFLPCSMHTDEKLGLYPVVDSAEWLSRLIPRGINIIQLRVKSLLGDALEQEIAEAIAIARQFNCRLFINDYWQLAIKHGAYGVHLGQEDLDTADIDAIRTAGLRLGLSTHCLLYTSPSPRDS